MNELKSSRFCDTLFLLKNGVYTADFLPQRKGERLK